MNQYIVTLLVFAVLYFGTHIVMYAVVHEPKKTRLEQQLQELCKKPNSEYHAHCQKLSKQ